MPSPPSEAAAAAAGGKFGVISIDDRDALDDVRFGDRLTRLGSFVIVVVVVLLVAAEGSCGIDEAVTPAEDDDDGGATGRIAVGSMMRRCWNLLFYFIFIFF